MRFERESGGQAAEALLACNVLNQMTDLGRPQSYSIVGETSLGWDRGGPRFDSCTNATDRRRGHGFTRGTFESSVADGEELSTDEREHSPEEGLDPGSQKRDLGQPWAQLEVLDPSPRPSAPDTSPHSICDRL